jgi:signal transduction histidine kinase
MKRRSLAGGKAGKAGRRKAVVPRRGRQPKSALTRRSTATTQETEVARLSRELNEAREQQTATADVLRVVGRSTFDLQTVLDTLVESAARLCEADTVVIGRPKGESFQYEASYGWSREWADFLANHPAAINRGTASGRALLECKIVHIFDALADPEYTYPLRLADNSVVEARTLLGVPLLREGSPIGVMTLGRKSVRPFTDKQIELAETFADQAVIAIENTRLLNELRKRTDDLTERTSELTEALEQQTATSEVLQVISSSPGDVQPVFATILENATRICEANFGNVYLWDGDAFHLVAAHNTPRAFADTRKRAPFRPNTGHPFRSLAETRQVFHVADIMTLPIYQEGDPQIVEAVKLGKMRTCLGVPMLKDNNLIGVVLVFRQEVRQFTANQIALITNFAAQAVIAIENARLLNELRQRTDDLSRSLEDLRTTQDRLVQTQKLASLGQLTAGIAHEIKNPLNFVNNFSDVSVELIDELQEALQGVQADDRTRSEIGELAGTLRDNLGKIVQHGRRADAIVKNMLLHSREGSGEHRPVDINAIVEEALNLPYHGARAEKQGFNITLQRSFDPEAGQADVFPQDITRVLLNLISNGFYAATKRKGLIGGEGFQPTVAAVTRSLGDRVEIGIRDNGTGISPEVKEKMFNPFFTTKPAGEGTGLGLSISYDIVVKQHAGSIEVDTQPGEFTEIRIILPRFAAHLSW